MDDVMSKALRVLQSENEFSGLRMRRWVYL